MSTTFSGNSRVCLDCGNIFNGSASTECPDCGYSKSTKLCTFQQWKETVAKLNGAEHKTITKDDGSVEVTGMHKVRVALVTEQLAEAGFSYDEDFTTLYGAGWEMTGVCFMSGGAYATALRGEL